MRFSMLVRNLRSSIAAVRHFSAVVKAASGGAKKEAGERRDTLGRRLLRLVYARHSAVVTIRKWKEEEGTVRKYELNRIVRELRKLRRYKHALEICEWMTLQEDMKLVAGDYAVQLDLIAKVRGMNSAEKFFEDLPEQMRDGTTCSALLHTYVQNKESEKAEALFEKMKECGFMRNSLPYNHMMSLYVSNGKLDKVPEVIGEMKVHTKLDVVTYNLWLTVCASQNDVESAERVFLELKKAKVSPDWVTLSTLTNLYIKSSQVEKAAATSKEMEKMVSRKHRVAYSSLISLLANIGDKAGVQRVWKKLKSCFPKMNDAEYTCMIASLMKLKEIEEAEKIYTEWESVTGTHDPRVSNIILAAYINKDQMDVAETFCSRMVQNKVTPCYSTWELLTWGYLKQKHTKKMLEYFKKAVGSVKKWDPHHKLIAEVFSRLNEESNVEEAEELLAFLRNAGHVSTETYNSLLRSYAQARKMPLLIEERMKKDNVELNKETRSLLKRISKLCGSEDTSICSPPKVPEENFV
ncbi:pentatricopeptide repeat-containing protein At4g02820, mitochondrial [Argentina anserina]|uniref:pentatricopeptide repeat-containing protein At4g02820, mitochondrial n=1 Tax=Argentina anserina TaxID=57926 RepID=UPI0021769485|nr:pentatricopeptide repeat-containing protein At4g02820, mitochondrial [Potentilla anserina]